MVRHRSPSFTLLTPSSTHASAAARGASRKAGTRCELLLRTELRRRGLRFIVNEPRLVGRPDIVFPDQWIACFCDGDFWHGRLLSQRLRKLADGSNPKYWVKEIRTNVARDRSVRRTLRLQGWTILRFWESD